MKRFNKWPRKSRLADFLTFLDSTRKTNIVEHMFKMMEEYSCRLEEEVKARTEELETEKRKNDRLIQRMLPP